MALRERSPRRPPSGIRSKIMNDVWATDWLGRFNGNEPTSLIELYAEDARFEDITLRHAVRGRPALRKFFGNTFTFISYSGNAYGGAIEWTWTARHRAPILDLPAEGKETRIGAVSVVRNSETTGTQEP